MKHFALKFTHGVEIGAEMAYRGHYMRTKDPKVLEIANDERSHRRKLDYALLTLQTKPSWLITKFFTFVGHSVAVTCLIAPKASLNWVARLLEAFAVFSYEKLALKYPQFQENFIEMAGTEKRHQQYFTRSRNEEDRLFMGRTRDR
jgi:rubrerythrin